MPYPYQLEAYYEAKIEHLEKSHNQLESRVRELEAELAIADKGLMKASDPKSGWAGISKECKLWQERAEQAEAERDRLKADVSLLDLHEELRASHAALVAAAHDVDDAWESGGEVQKYYAMSKLKAALAEVKK